jgi:hypothetical protein
MAKDFVRLHCSVMSLRYEDVLLYNAQNVALSPVEVRTRLWGKGTLEKHRLPGYIVRSRFHPTRSGELVMLTAERIV